MEEKNEKEPPPLTVDPKCIQDALRAFLLPIKNDDARLDFYTMYKKEATDYDTNYVKKYDDDLNTTLIFAGLFSAVSSAFILDIQSKLEPDPNEQSAALLRAILLTLNQSAIPDESVTVPPLHEGTPSEITTASCLMYASLLVSLLAAFIAMLGKQWLNRYLRHSGGSTIERCGDRQRKLEGLERWPFHTFVECLPVMLQIALLLLACGLYRQMASVNTSVAGVLVVFTALGVLFYLGVVVTGASSYQCPFQTPASTALRELWKEIRPRMGPVVLPITGALHSLWDAILCRVLRTLLRLPFELGIWRRLHRPRPSNVGEDLSSPRFAVLRNLWEETRSRIPHTALRLPPALKSTLRHHLCHPPLPTVQDSPPIPQEITPWMMPKDLAVFLRDNGSDVRCVSWILRNITDPEAVDATVRLAGTIRWFEDRADIEPPYDVIVSIFEACFDSAKNVYPRLEDRAYYSLRAILWIHALANCKSEGKARGFPLPIAGKVTPSQDDLTHLLCVCRHLTDQDAKYFLHPLYTIPDGASYVHAQWASNLLLHLAWTKQGDPAVFRWYIEDERLYQYNDWDAIPLDATLNRFLVWCIFLGSPVEREVLTIQDKSDRLERISTQLHQAIIVTILTQQYGHYDLLQAILHSLTTWKSRPSFFTEMAYEWCSVICEQRLGREGEDSRVRELLFLSLEIGFRHLDFRDRDEDVELAHTAHHQRMVDVVFKYGSGETIADLLHAWTSSEQYGDPYTSLHTCASHLIGLQRLRPFSPRLRHLIISSIGLIGFQKFGQVGTEKTFELLDYLRIRVEDVDSHKGWAEFLLNVIRSPEGIHRLPYPYWELMVELILQGGVWLCEYYSNYSHIMESLEGAGGWDRLECWIGFVWHLWGPNQAANLESATLSLLRQQSGGVRKLEQWMKRSKKEGKRESFQRLREQGSLNAAGQHTPIAPLTDGGSGEPPHPLGPTVPLSLIGDDTF